MYYEGKPVKEEYKALFDYMEYLETQMTNARKMWQFQDYEHLLTKVYEYLDHLNFQGKLLK